MHCRGDDPSKRQNRGGGNDCYRQIALFDHLFPQMKWRSLGGHRAGGEEDRNAQNGENDGIEGCESGQGFNLAGCRLVCKRSGSWRDGGVQLDRLGLPALWAKMRCDGTHLLEWFLSQWAGLA